MGLILARFGTNWIHIFFFFFEGGAGLPTRCYTLLQAIIVCNFKENY